ncbi:MAG: hypothetical protein KW804_03055 [Candidatus Doudnabacteria bacterium]|nr:hypothetical protein [Candidatus Doudnabacteria bacterium]
MKNNFTKIIASVILGSVILTNFAFAQTPTTPQGTALTPKFLADAQKSQAECMKFRNAIFNESGKLFKAVFVPALTIQGSGGVPSTSIASSCRIIPADAPDKDGIFMHPDYTTIPPGSYDLQRRIEHGDGIVAGIFTTAFMADVESKTEASWFSKLVGWTLNWVLSVVNFFLLWMTALAGDIFTTTVHWILDGTKTVPDFIYIGWAIVRDISNMFFILILIVIGLAAILRIESYDYRHLLVETVIMALLVNFSLIIATTLIDFVGTLTALFDTRHGEIWSFLYSNVNFGDTHWSEMPNGWMAGLFQGLTKIVFTFVGLATFLALAGLFIVRVIGIYVLLVFSPLAYVLDVLPATKHFAHEWWQYFIKYLIWPPVALFVLRLAMLVAKDPAFANPDDSAFKFIVLMGFMWGAVIVAEHAGMVGGQAIVQGAEKFAHNLGHGFQHMVGGYVGRKWNERTVHLLESHDGKEVGVGKRALFAVLNPIAAFKGSQQRSHELSHMAQEEAAAGGREVAEQAFTTKLSPFKTVKPWKEGFLEKDETWGKAKLKIPYRQFVARKDEDMFLKDYGNMKKESLMRAAVDAEGMTGFEGEARKRAIVKAAATNGYLDDLMRMKPFAEKYTGKDNVIYGAESLNRFLYGYLGHGEQSMRFMAEDMEEAGKKTKHFEYLGHAYYDPDKKEWTRGMDADGTETVTRGGKAREVTKFKPLTKDTWQVGYSTGEFGKLGGRDRVGAAPHNFTVVRAEVDSSNEFLDKGSEIKDHLTFGRTGGDFDTFNVEMLKKMDADVMREVQHAQARVKSWILSDTFVPKTNGAIIVEDNEHALELQKLYKIQPEFAKGLYTKVLKVKGDAREKMDGIRYILESDVIRDPGTGEVTGFNPGGVKDIGTPSFKYEENPPEVTK